VFVVALVLGLAALYGPTLPYGFVFDDVPLVAENPSLREPGGVGQIMASLGSERRPAVQRQGWLDPGYRPLRMLSYALDVRVYGMGRSREDLKPWGFRLTNILLHLLAALLVAAVGRHLAGRYAGVGASLIFALHPLQAEAVTYISGRRDVLFGVLTLLGLWLFLRYRASGRRWLAPAIVAVYLLALGAKEMAITLPLVCLVYDVAIGGARGVRNRVAFYAAMFAIAAAYAAYVLLVKNPAFATAADIEPLAGSPVASVMTMAWITCRYLGLVLWPATLTVDYSHAAVTTTALTHLASPVILGAVAWGGVRLWRAGARLEAAHLLAFFVMLLPVLQIVRHPEPMAERYLYLPIVPLALLACRGMVQVAMRTHRALYAVGLLALILVALFTRAAVRNADWRDDGTLFRAAAEAYPACARANLGNARHLAAAGDRAGALDALDRALAVLPRDAHWRTRLGAMRVTALFERAIARAEVGLVNEALGDLDAVLAQPFADGQTLAESPEHVNVTLNRAALLKRLDRVADAQAAYMRVLRLAERLAAQGASSGARAAAMPYQLEARLQLADLAARSGRLAEARALLTEAAGPEPTAINARAWMALAQLLAATGERTASDAVYGRIAATDIAIAAHALYRQAELAAARGDRTSSRALLERAVQRDPGLLAARLSLADVLLSAGEIDAAQAQVDAILAARPGEVTALRKLADIVIARAQPEKARPARETRRERRDAPDRDRAGRLVRMAAQAWLDGRVAGAVKALEAAADVDPTWSVPHRRLGELQLELGRPEQARRPLEEAYRLEPEAGPRLLLPLATARAAAGDMEGARAALVEAEATAAAERDLLLGQAAGAMARFRFEAADRALRSAQRASDVMAQARRRRGELGR
jgi:tetratricopeptide (TPR) repeat protein